MGGLLLLFDMDVDIDVLVPLHDKDIYNLLSLLWSFEKHLWKPKSTQARNRNRTRVIVISSYSTYGLLISALKLQRYGDHDVRVTSLSSVSYSSYSFALRWLPETGTHWPWCCITGGVQETHSAASAAAAHSSESSELAVEHGEGISTSAGTPAVTSWDDACLPLLAPTPDLKRALDEGVGAGWYHQQMLKLYADVAAERFDAKSSQEEDDELVPKLDTNLRDHVVWMDADVAVHRGPLRFFGDDNEALVPMQPPGTANDALHERYREHRLKLLQAMSPQHSRENDWPAVHSDRGCVCHHMPIPPGATTALRACYVDPEHGLWKAFLSAAASCGAHSIKHGCASEYELMARFVNASQFPAVPRELVVVDQRADEIQTGSGLDADLVVSHVQWVGVGTALARRRSAADGKPDAVFARSQPGSAERARARRFG